MMYQKADKPVDVHNYVDNRVDMHEFRGSYFDRCILWVRMDEMNGTVVKDWSFNDNSGTRIGATWFAAGKFHHCLDFDGLNDYVDIGKQLITVSVFSICFWAKSGGAQNTYTCLVSQGHNPCLGGGSSCGFAFQYGYPSATDFRFIWGGGAATGFDHAKSLTYNINLETDFNWHFYAVVRNGADIRAYKDGALTEAKTNGNTMYFGTYNVNIGRDTSNADSNHRTFNGLIDEVRFYENRALSADEIRKRYEIGRRPPI